MPSSVRCGSRARLTAAAGLAFLLVGAALLFQRTLAVDTYTTFIVGWPASAGANKIRDINLALALISLGIGAAFLAAPLLRRLGQEPRLREYPIFEIGLLAALPLLFAIGLAASSSSSPTKAGAAAVAGLGVLAIISASLLLTRRAEGLDDVKDRVALIGGTTLLAGLIPFVVAVVLLKVLNVSFAMSTVLSASAVVVLVTFAYAVRSWRAGGPHRTASLAAAVQLLLAPGYLAIIPTFQQGAVAAQVVRLPLYLLVALLVALAMFDVVRRLRRGDRPFSPPACGAILAMVSPGLPLLILSNDDYHFGEFVNGWWSLKAGLLPYVDYDLAHGLINYLPGALAALFFDGTASSVLAGISLSTFLQQLFLYGVLAAFLPLPMTLAAAVLSISVVQGPLPAMGIAIGVLCIPALLHRPSVWTVCWVLVGTTLVLLVPGQGAALILATMPFGIWMACRALTTEPRRAVLLAATLGLFLALLALTTPFVAVLAGALRYVTENSAINLLAYGVNWVLSFDETHRDHSPPEQAIRVLWILLPAVGIAVLMTRDRVREWVRKPEIVLLSCIAIFVPLTLLSYVFGRIDPGNLSRPGSFSAWVLAVLLPLLFVKLRRPTLAAASIAMLLLLTFGFDNYPRLIEIVDARLRVSVVPDEILAMPEQHGLANVGALIPDPQHSDGVARLRRALDSRLAPGDQYLDMTGRTAQYVYVDRVIPRHAGAPFNLAHPAQQSRLIATLAEKRPKLILLHSTFLPSLNADGLTASLRTPLLYRWIIENYVPFEAEGFVFARPRTAGQEAGETEDVRVAIRNITDQNWENGVLRSGDAVVVESAASTRGLDVGETLGIGGSERRVVSVEGDRIYLDGPPLRPEDGYPNAFTFSRDALSGELGLWEMAFGVDGLFWIPQSWGRSFDNLDGVAMTRFRDLPEKSSLDGLSVTADLPAGFAGRSAGLLTFDFACEPMNAPADLRVSFRTGDAAGTIDKVRFYGSNGRVIVPLDSRPAWLLSPIVSLDIELEDASDCGAASFSNFALYQRALLD